MAKINSHHVVLTMGLALIATGLLVGVFTAVALFVPIIIVLGGAIAVLAFFMRHRIQS